MTNTTNSHEPSLYKLPTLSLLMLIIEIAVIVSVSLYSTREYQDWSPRLKIGGDEFSYLINSGAIASKIFQQTGAIPLWNPFVRMGEPLLENPFSYMLNPLMTFPVLYGGMFQGPKFALLLQVVLLGLGGWTLGRVLRLHSAGRVLLGLMLAGNGSLVGAVSGGFYQMALTQTYIPWVLAGLIGTIYLHRRWPVALLTIATTLMLFGGTFWYVLPAAIICALIVAFHLRVHPETRMLTFDGWVFKRLLIAGVFIIFLSMVRLLPQIAHADYVVHPLASLTRTDPLETLFSFYVDPTLHDLPYAQFFMFYHYITPFWFLALVVVMRLLIYKPFYSIFTNRGRIVIPLLLAILFFTLWGQEDTPLMEWLYNTFTFFKEWRFLARMMAAATPLIAVLIAIWFDDVAYAAKPVVGRTRRWVNARLADAQGNIIARLPTLSRAVLIIMVVAGTFAAFNVQANWSRLGGLNSIGLDANPGVTYLRDQNPTKFLSVITAGFFSYFTHWDTLTRAYFGNPDYRPRGDYSTLGRLEMMPKYPEYASGVDEGFSNYLREQNFTQIEGSPALANILSLWYNPAAPTYSFLVNIERLKNSGDPLTASDTIPTSYYHQIDRVVVPITGSYPAGSVLVIQETAYPGWEVTINGQSVHLESVGELLGVVLPDPDPANAAVEVVFEYRPRLFYVGAICTVLAALALTIYLLRLDIPLGRYVPVEFSLRVLRGLRGIGQRALRILTDEKLLSGKDED
ncbi:MAG: hypothetical protein U0528_17420 [Anaerolineae bacterium]